MILDTAMNDTRAKVLICIFLIVATFCIYSQVQDHEFINFDDEKYITDNWNVQAGFTRESIHWAFTKSHYGDWQPITWLSYILDYQLYGLNPKGYHLTSLFFHIANSLILFMVLLRMTGALWQCGFVAAMFALHPFNVESSAGRYFVDIVADVAENSGKAIIENQLDITNHQHLDKVAK